MRFLHLVVGGIVFVVFLSTGGYMQNRFPGIYHGNEAIRMMFRANHIYILLASSAASGSVAPAINPNASVASTVSLAPVTS